MRIGVTFDVSVKFWATGAIRYSIWQGEYGVLHRVTSGCDSCHRQLDDGVDSRQRLLVWTHR